MMMMMTDMKVIFTGIELILSDRVMRVPKAPCTRGSKTSAAVLRERSLCRPNGSRSSFTSPLLELALEAFYHRHVS